MLNEDRTHPVSNRRQFLVGIGTAGAAALAGCTGGSNGGSEDGNQEKEEDEILRNGEQYFFEDPNNTMGQLGEQNPPSEAEDWQVVRNELSEDQWQEKQQNDVERAKDLANFELRDSIDEIIQRTEEIYVNKEFNFTVPEIINIEEEDDEVTFTRALVKAAREAGVDSSALANDVVSNTAEHAVNKLDVVDFDNYKLSTVPATEEASGRGGHAGGKKPNGKGNSGFRHMPAVLQYVKNGEAELKYAEMTTPGFAPILGEDAIREPEDSMYREELGQGRLKNGNYPLHFVACTDYTKARELESREENILGYDVEEGYEVEGEEFTKRTGLGDQISRFLVQLVDDVYVTGYDDGENEINPDIDLPAGQGLGSTVVSDEFGKSLEEIIIEPTVETREYMESIGRGIYKIRQEKGWDTQLALTGTVEDPEIRATTLKNISEIRANQNYGNVTEMVQGAA